MKSPLLMLAGALALNVGVMAAAAEAQQRGQTPPVRIPPTSTGPTFPGPGQGAAVIDPAGPGGNGGCTPGGVPGAGGAGGPCGPAAYPPFEYRLLPPIVHCLEKVEVGDLHLNFRARYCGQFLTAHNELCIRNGGTTSDIDGRTACLLPPARTAQFRRELEGLVRTIPLPRPSDPRADANPPRN